MTSADLEHFDASAAWEVEYSKPYRADAEFTYSQAKDLLYADIEEFGDVVLPIE